MALAKLITRPAAASLPTVAGPRFDRCWRGVTSRRVVKLSRILLLTLYLVPNQMPKCLMQNPSLSHQLRIAKASHEFVDLYLTQKNFKAHELLCSDIAERTPLSSLEAVYEQLNKFGVDPSKFKNLKLLMQMFNCMKLSHTV
ncbi:hypothetical protein P4S63_23720 [Pseudoalteromonas sp. B193]